MADQPILASMPSCRWSSRSRRSIDHRHQRAITSNKQLPWWTTTTTSSFTSKESIAGGVISLAAVPTNWDLLLSGANSTAHVDTEKRQYCELSGHQVDDSQNQPQSHALMHLSSVVMGITAHQDYCPFIFTNKAMQLRHNLREFKQWISFRTSELPRTVPTHHSGACCRGKPSNSWPGDHPLKASANWVNYRHYQPERDIHLTFIDGFRYRDQHIRGEACATAAAQLKQQGFQPNLICAISRLGRITLSQWWVATYPICLIKSFLSRREIWLWLWSNSAMVYLAGNKKQTLDKNKLYASVLESSSWNIKFPGIQAEQLAA